MCENNNELMQHSEKETKLQAVSLALKNGLEAWLRRREHSSGCLQDAGGMSVEIFSF